MKKTLKELREAAAKAATRMREINDKARAEDRGITAEEEQEWNNARADFERLEGEITRTEYSESAESRYDEIIRKYVTDENGNQVEVGLPNSQTRADASDRRGAVKFCGKVVRSPYVARGGVHDEPADLGIAFDGLMRRGLGGLTAEHRKLIDARHVDAEEFRAQSVGTTTAGGYTVPQDFGSGIEVALKQFGGVRNVATVIPTGDGRDLPWPTVNDTGNVGVLITENTADTEQDVTFGQVTFKAYMFTSKVVRVSKELLQDSAVDVGALLSRLFGERLGRGTAAYYATGTGSSQPQGIITAATLGKGAASATAFTYAEMIDLKHSVDPSYRMGAKWLLHDSILKAVKQLKDSEGRPIWQPNIALAVPATIDGDGYQIEQGMDSALTTGKKIMAYGDLSKFQIRDVLGFQLVVLHELYALNRQVGFNMFMRTDSRLLDAGTNPVKYLALA